MYKGEWGTENVHKSRHYLCDDVMVWVIMNYESHMNNGWIFQERILIHDVETLDDAMMRIGKAVSEGV